jgi:hypothetical protein
MSDEAIARLRQIATQTWQRHFDDSLGLADEESRRLQATRAGEPDMTLPHTEQLLADRPNTRSPGTMSIALRSNAATRAMCWASTCNCRNTGRTWGSCTI